MSKKPDTAAALAGILKAKRGEEPAASLPPPREREADTPPPPAPAMATASPPSPALPPTPSPAVTPKVALPPANRRSGKRSDKATYSQFSLYLRRDTRKKVGRALDDLDDGQDFSDLVQTLLEQWLASRT